MRHPPSPAGIRSTIVVTCLAALGPAALAQAPAPMPTATTTATTTATPTRTLSFADAMSAALQNDAQYRAAAHELESARFGVPIARAALLPAVNLSAATAEVQGHRQFPNSLNQDVRVRVEYNTPQASLSMRMPIFNQDARKRVDQAEAQVEGAEFVHRRRGLDLVDRVALAYLSVLLADEGKTLAREQEQAETLRLAQGTQRLQRGEGTRIDVAQAQAALDVARVRTIEADDQLELARRQLRVHTGLVAPALARLPDAVVPAGPEIDGLNEWLAIAGRHSPIIQAREQAVVVARIVVDRNRAAHLPRLDLVASLSRSQNESLSSLNQTSTLRSLGVQLSVPIFSGGGISASVDQARAEVERAEADLRAEREGVALEIQRYHQAVAGGADRVKAYQRAVESSELALTGYRRGLEAGVATSIEVGDAVARVYAARRELARTRIELLMSLTKLRLAAGLPMAEVAQSLDGALVASSAVTPRP